MKHVDNNKVNFNYMSFKNTLTFSTINIMVRSFHSKHKLDTKSHYSTEKETQVKSFSS